MYRIVPVKVKVRVRFSEGIVTNRIPPTGYSSTHKHMPSLSYSSFHLFPLEPSQKCQADFGQLHFGQIDFTRRFDRNLNKPAPAYNLLNANFRRTCTRRIELVINSLFQLTMLRELTRNVSHVIYRLGKSLAYCGFGAYVTKIDFCLTAALLFALMSTRDCLWKTKNALSNRRFCYHQIRIQRVRDDLISQNSCQRVYNSRIFSKSKGLESSVTYDNRFQSYFLKSLKLHRSQICCLKSYASDYVQISFL